MSRPGLPRHRHKRDKADLSAHVVPKSFVGICVATSADPACDDYVLDHLRDMGIGHVRVDYTLGSDQNQTARLLEHLLANDIKVLLHMVQPVEAARGMDRNDAQEEWREFVEHTLNRWGGSIEAVEIGSTVNRRKWSGYTLSRFMKAWRIAHEIARKHQVRLAGPNVTDFEPLYNFALLFAMRLKGLLPDAHTDNLFVERVTEPENYDHRILGRTIGSIIKCDLINKARLLNRIAEMHGVSETWSTHVAWSKRRIERVLCNFADKQADYLARYFILAAASTSLGRVYWGPMIGQREGVVDDGTDEYPDARPHVNLYDFAKGHVSGYKIRPALRALQTFVELIPGAEYDGSRVRAFGLEAHAFKTEKHMIHALWTINGKAAAVEGLYDAKSIEGSEWISRDGCSLEVSPVMITESPVYVRWPRGRSVEVKQNAAPLPRLSIYKPARIYRDDVWQGFLYASGNAEYNKLLEVIAPDKLDGAEKKEVLRDARNAVWSIADPCREGGLIVVKRALQTKWHRKIFDCLKPSKARRSWNGACELLRRGIDTPRPIAFFEHRHYAVAKLNYYLCEFVAGDLSVRSFFTAFAAGEDAFNGISSKDFYEHLSEFILAIHKRGVFFRDLSAGNVIVVSASGETPSFALIDTARARFAERPLEMRKRLSDLKRICHPLDWGGREAFVGTYLQKLDQQFTRLRRLPFHLYDAKHRIKNKLRGR